MKHPLSTLFNNFAFVFGMNTVLQLVHSEILCFNFDNVCNDFFVYLKKIMN